MRTEPPAPPDHLTPDVERRIRDSYERKLSAEQTVRIPLAWWRDSLDAHGAGDQMFTVGEVTDDVAAIRRRDLLDYAPVADDNDQRWLAFLWAVVAWGSGARHRLGLKRIHHAQTLGAGLLREAATLATSSPVEAYTLLRPSNNRYPYLGPAFFTKLLYFATAGAGSPPALILDRFVARALRDDIGWSAAGQTDWSAAVYERYITAMDGWAHDLGVLADEIAFWAFTRGRELAGLDRASARDEADSAPDQST